MAKVFRLRDLTPDRPILDLGKDGRYECALPEDFSLETEALVNQAQAKLDEFQALFTANPQDPEPARLLVETLQDIVGIYVPKLPKKLRRRMTQADCEGIIVFWTEQCLPQYQSRVMERMQQGPYRPGWKASLQKVQMGPSASS